VTLKIKVKLFATLMQYLPASAVGHVLEMDVPEDITVGTIVTQLNLPPELTHLVLINGVFIPPHARAEKTMVAGDELAVFPPVAGG
jgi:sulfur carrier protein ThiS